MNNGQLLKDIEQLKLYYNSGATKSYRSRRAQLQKLKKAVLQYEEEIHAALYQDLKKSPEESWVTETGFVMTELNVALQHLHHWMKNERVGTPFLSFPSSSYIMHEPLGVVLIIGPWNYPFMLLLAPLIGAIAAGNCVVLKPSELAPATSAVVKRLVEATFAREYILYVEGDGASVVPAMMKNYRFDHVFFTGSTAVGNEIYRMAADKLVPVTLELGGKSPAVIEADADITVAARRIAVATFTNAGQMCVAPDYILVQEAVKTALIEAMKKAMLQFFSHQAEESYNYGKIINVKQFDRLVDYLDHGKIIIGGRHDRDRLFIEPTLIEEMAGDAPLMKEEIFGPILPVIAFKDAAEAKAIIDINPDPLAFYVFTSSSQSEQWWLQEIHAGGVCINNAAWHLTNHHLPFGGRGSSGMGRYHGKFSFETFSHKKAVMKTPTWFDPNVKYPPFKGRLGLFKKFIR